MLLYREKRFCQSTILKFYISQEYRNSIPLKPPPAFLSNLKEKEEEKKKNLVKTGHGLKEMDWERGRQERKREAEGSKTCVSKGRVRPLLRPQVKT